MEDLFKILETPCSCESIHLSKEDIYNKEMELQIKLPSSLVKLYSMLSPDDSPFLFKFKLIPFDQLKSYKMDSNCATYFLVPFLYDNDQTYAFVTRIIPKGDTEEGNPFDADNPPIIRYYSSSKQNIGNISGGKISKVSLNDWITHCLGYAQIYLSPNIVAIDADHTEIDKEDSLWNSLHPVSSIYSRIRLSADNNVLALNSYERAPEPFPTYSFVLAAQSSTCLTKLERDCGVRFIWLKTNGQFKGMSNQEAFSPSARELNSIHVVLDYLKLFANITEEKCATQKSVFQAEQRIQQPMPLPLKEFYLQLPLKYYSVYNSFRPLSRLRPMKDGKINFLEENQGSFYCAVKAGSPFIYQKVLGERSEWEPIGVLDGYLVSEFFWVLACAQDLDMELWEYPNFDAKMLDKDGKLLPYFSDIAGVTYKISEGNFMRLYQVCDGNALALYEKITPKLYLLAKTSEDLDCVIEKFGFPKEQ